MFACNGILFNHESPRRGETFVTRKISRGLVNIAQGNEKCLYMGNIDSMRDWGHAKDYVEMQWMMLQQDKADDFVIASGNQFSVKDFIGWAAEDLGINIRFEGDGLEEVAIVDSVVGDNAPAVKSGDIIMRIDPVYFRPSEVNSLCGDPSKAKKVLGWEPKISAREICKEMVNEDLKIAKNNKS